MLTNRCKWTLHIDSYDSCTVCIPSSCNSDSQDHCSCMLPANSKFGFCYNNSDTFDLAMDYWITGKSGVRYTPKGPSSRSSSHCAIYWPSCIYDPLCNIFYFDDPTFLIFRSLLKYHHDTYSKIE